MHTVQSQRNLRNALKACIPSSAGNSLRGNDFPGSMQKRREREKVRTFHKITIPSAILYNFVQKHKYSIKLKHSTESIYEGKSYITLTAPSINEVGRQTAHAVKCVSAVS